MTEPLDLTHVTMIDISDHAPSVAAPASLREALKDAKYSNSRTHGAHDHDKTVDCGGEFVVGNCVVRAALRAESVAAPAEIDAVIREQTRVAPEYDGAHREPNHYDWFMPENVEQHVDGYLDDLEAKLRQSLGDFYVHDMAMAVLPLIVAYREAKAARHAPPALDAAPVATDTSSQIGARKRRVSGGPIRVGQHPYIERVLAEAHWWLVVEGNWTSEPYLALLDRIEPLVSREVADEADAFMAAETGRAATPASGEPAAPCVRVSNPDQGIDSHWCLTHDAEWLLGAARCVARGSAPPAAGAEPPR